MKLLGSSAEDSGGRGQPQPPRSQDDAAVGYVFQRHVHDPEFSQFAQKQHHWASGDDTIMDVSAKWYKGQATHDTNTCFPQNQDKWKYNGLVNSGGGLLNQSSKMSHSPQVQQMMNHHQQLQQQQMHMHLGGGGSMHHPQQSHHLAPPQQQQPHHHLHPLGTNAASMSNNNMSHLGGQQSMSQQQQQQQQSQPMSNLAAAGLPLQMAAIQGGLYDHHHQNGIHGQLQNTLAPGTPKMSEQMVYLRGGGQHLSVMPPQSQYLTTPMNRNSMGVSCEFFEGTDWWGFDYPVDYSHWYSS